MGKNRSARRTPFKNFVLLALPAVRQVTGEQNAFQDYAAVFAIKKLGSLWQKFGIAKRAPMKINKKLNLRNLPIQANAIFVIHNSMIRSSIQHDIQYGNLYFARSLDCICNTHSIRASAWHR
jgi:hypothetical protein